MKNVLPKNHIGLTQIAFNTNLHTGYARLHTDNIEICRISSILQFQLFNKCFTKCIHNNNKNLSLIVSTNC